MTRLLFFPHDIKLPNYINTTRRRRSIGNFHTLRTTTTTTSILAIYALYSLCLLSPFHLIPEVLLSALCSTFETFFNVSRNFHKLPTILKKSKNFLSKIHTHTHQQHSTATPRTPMVSTSRVVVGMGMQQNFLSQFLLLYFKDDFPRLPRTKSPQKPFHTMSDHSGRPVEVVGDTFRSCDHHPSVREQRTTKDDRTAENWRRVCVEKFSSAHPRPQSGGSWCVCSESIRRNRNQSEI